MEVISALANQNIEKRLRQASTLKKRLLADGNQEERLVGRQLKRRQGVIQQCVVEVLTEANRPLTIMEIRRRVEVKLGGPVSRHTVTGFLSDAVRYGRHGVVRVGRGVYELKGVKS